MNLLFDTHIWIWAVNNPAKLHRRVKTELANPNNTFWLSPISCWEIMTLARKRRIDIRGVAPDVWITRALNTLPLEQASISNEIAVRSELIQLPHWDPADRFLAATAIESRFVLVTGDLLLLRCPDVETLSNR